MRRLPWLMAATFPVAIVTTLAWFGVFTFVNSYLVRDLGWSNQEWTAATLCMTAAMFFWYPLCTELSSRFGRRRTVLLTMLLVCAAYGIITTYPGRWMIRLAMVLIGGAIPASLTSWTPFVAEAARDRPGRAINLVSLTLNLVCALALLTGGRLMAWAGAHAFFLGATILCGGCAAVFCFLSGYIERRIRREEARIPALVPMAKSGVSMRNLSREQLREFLHSPMPFIILFGVCAAPFCFHTSNQLFPNLARDAHHMNEASIATLVGVGRIPTLITLSIFSILIDRLNACRLYGIGLVLDGLVLSVVALAASPAVLGFGYLAFYLVHGLVWSSGLPAISLCVRPSLRDSAFALTLMIEMATIVTVGFFHNRMLALGVSLGTIFLICACVTFLAGGILVAYSFHPHSRPRPAEATEPSAVN